MKKVNRRQKGMQSECAWADIHRTKGGQTTTVSNETSSQSRIARRVRPLFLSNLFDYFTDDSIEEDVCCWTTLSWSEASWTWASNQDIKKLYTLKHGWDIRDSYGTLSIVCFASAMLEGRGKIMRVLGVGGGDTGIGVTGAAKVNDARMHNECEGGIVWVRYPYRETLADAT